ncbi:unnamed protein product [Vitrella brassicaformis CCMP3155]|uniref:P25-alpha family protein n=1 Tax=Vitrella brassicaformis (strain CCMP3155) TaxID=1169540 RepID=A0A0G4EWD5_VITBC|nr:unnamed protein product [Vitrella brassicaformis CCMP3155]|eukprot:CEM02660.1 unnamed protein product [Vitrella brassicaformis CCMP3155]
MADVSEAFRSFAGGASELDGRQFVKLCKVRPRADCRIIDSKCTSTDVDLIFAKVKQKAARKINLFEFEQALELLAEKKKISVSDLKNKIGSSQGPVLTGTKTEAVKFYDDKSTFTGVHQHGGPSTVDKGRNKFSDLSEFCDRTPADVRGIKSLK